MIPCLVEIEMGLRTNDTDPQLRNNISTNESQKATVSKIHKQ